MAGLSPQQTLVPFEDLPDCASDCGPLYDANGGCVPPVFPTGSDEDYQNCFCTHTAVAGFRTGIQGVCADGICPNSDLSEIQAWFAEFCGVEEFTGDETSGDDAGDTGNSGNSGNSGGSNATPTTKAKSSNSGGGDWLSTHWQWVVMLVILAVGIAGIWIGACIWRRHYLKKKERTLALGKQANGAQGGNPATWGPGVAPPNPHAAGPVAFMSPANGHATTNEKQKKRKSKWIVKERT